MICPIYKASQIIAHKGFTENIDPSSCQCDNNECALANDSGACSFRSGAECLETALSAASNFIPALKESDDEPENSKEEEE